MNSKFTLSKHRWALQLILQSLPVLGHLSDTEAQVGIAIYSMLSAAVSSNQVSIAS